MEIPPQNPCLYGSKKNLVQEGVVVDQGYLQRSDLLIWQVGHCLINSTIWVFMNGQ
jgi:hypothetical protein